MKLSNGCHIATCRKRIIHNFNVANWVSYVGWKFRWKWRQWPIS